MWWLFSIWLAGDVHPWYKSLLFFLFFSFSIPPRLVQIQPLSILSFLHGLLGMWECLYTFGLCILRRSTVRFLYIFFCVLNLSYWSLQAVCVCIYILLIFHFVFRLQKYEVITRLLEKLPSKSMYHMFCFRLFQYCENVACCYFV